VTPWPAHCPCHPFLLGRLPRDSSSAARCGFIGSRFSSQIVTGMDCQERSNQMDTCSDRKRRQQFSWVQCEGAYCPSINGGASYAAEARARANWGSKPQGIQVALRSQGPSGMRRPQSAAGRGREGVDAESEAVLARMSGRREQRQCKRLRSGSRPAPSRSCGGGQRPSSSQSEKGVKGRGMERQNEALSTMRPRPRAQCTAQLPLQLHFHSPSPHLQILP